MSEKEDDEIWFRRRFGKREVWEVTPGKGSKYWGDFQKRGIMSVANDYPHIGDLRNYKSKTDVLKKLQEITGTNTNPIQISNWYWQFTNKVKVGDVLLSTSGRYKIFGWGKVTGEYEYDDSPENPDLRHWRTVKWNSLQEQIDLPPEWKGVGGGPIYPCSKVRKDWVRYVFGRIDKNQESGDNKKQATLEPNDQNSAFTDLFISQKQIDRILRSIEDRKNLILQGPPGVGKTFIAKRIAQKLIGPGDLSAVEMVQFHQSYAYEDFVQGWRPTEKGGFKLRNGVFFEFCQRAEKRPKTSFVFIIDEINRGNLSRIFGELLMLIETDKRGMDHAIPLTYSETGQRFSVPENVHILGLMNTADRSLAMVDYALRRRFAFETLQPAYRTENFRKYLRSKGVDKKFVTRIEDGLCAINDQIKEDRDLGPGFQIGHSYFVPNNENSPDDNWYRNIVETQIEPLLREYWFDRPEEADKLLDKLRP